MLPQGTTDPRNAYEELVSIRTAVLDTTEIVRDTCVEGNVSVSTLVSYHNYLLKLNDDLDAAIAVAGLQQYILDRGEVVNDIVIAVSGVKAAGSAIISFLRTNLIKDTSDIVSGYVLENGKYIWLRYTAQQVAPILPLLDDITNAVI